MKLAKKLVSIDFIRFCIVGTAGFIINYALLSLFYKQMGIHIFIAQLLASEVALFHNFAMHHNWTYKNKSRKQNKTLSNYLVEFHATSWVAIIGGALLVSFCVRVLHFDYTIALVVSSALALFWNFVWTKYFIWGEKDPEVEER